MAVDDLGDGQLLGDRRDPPACRPYSQILVVVMELKPDPSRRRVEVIRFTSINETAAAIAAAVVVEHKPITES